MGYARFLAMKKLLQINTTVNYGSHGRIAEEIGQLAIAHSWESYIAFGRYERHSASKLIKIGNEIDIAVHGLLTRIFDKHGLCIVQPALVIGLLPNDQSGLIQSI